MQHSTHPIDAGPETVDAANIPHVMTGTADTRFDDDCARLMTLLFDHDLAAVASSSTADLNFRALIHGHQVAHMADILEAGLAATSRANHPANGLTFDFVAGTVTSNGGYPTPIKATPTPHAG